MACEATLHVISLASWSLRSCPPQGNRLNEILFGIHIGLRVGRRRGKEGRASRGFWRGLLYFNTLVTNVILSAGTKRAVGKNLLLAFPQEGKGGRVGRRAFRHFMNVPVTTLENTHLSQ